MTSDLQVCYLGSSIPYEEGLLIQDYFFQKRYEGEMPDTLILLEHTPVYTLGRSANSTNILWDESQRSQAGISCIDTNRGGDVTYHGPGQLVGYPIIKLSERKMGVVDYVTAIEETLIRTLASSGLHGTGRDDRNRGVWYGNSKIAAIGIHVSRQITRHGFALNVSTHLNHYNGILACGIQDAGITSLAKELNTEINMDGVIQATVKNFSQVFNYTSVTSIDKPLLD